MSRHGVPYASWEEFCKSHGDLAGIYLACYDIFVDYSVVGLLKRSALYFVLVFYDHNAFRCLTFQFDKNGRILFVCRCTVEVEFSRVGSVFALKCDVFGASSDVHSVSCVYFVNTSVDCDDSVSTDVDETHLSSLKEVLCTKLIACCQSKFLVNRYSCTCDDTVDVAVYKVDLVCLEKVLDQELFS